MDSNSPLTSSEIEDVRSASRQGLKWVFSSTLLLQIVSWLATLYTVRLLDPRDYGIVALPDALFPYLMMFATLKLDLWLLRAGENLDRKEQTAFYLLLLLGLGATCLGMLSAPFLAWFYSYPELKPVAQIMCLMFIPRVMRLIPEARLRRELKFKSLAISNLLIGLARSVVQIVLALQGYGFWALIFGTVVAEFVLMLALIVIAGLPKRIAAHRSELRDAVRFGSAATLATVCWLIFSTADNLIVGKLFGAQVLGVYATAFLLTDLPLSKLSSLLMPAIEPLYAKLKNNPHEMQLTFLAVNQRLLLILAPCLIGLALVAQEFVQLAFGSKWSSMVAPLQALSIVALIRSITASVSSYCYASGHPRVMLKSSAMAALIMPPCFYLFATFWGLTGVFYAWLLVYPWVGPVFVMFTLERELQLPVSLFVRNLVPPLICASLMSLVVGLSFGYLAFSVPLMMVFKVVLGVMVYIVTLKKFFPLSYVDICRVAKLGESK